MLSVAAGSHRRYTYYGYANYGSTYYGQARYGASVACRAVPSGDTPLHVLAAMSGDGALAALQVLLLTYLLYWLY